MSVTADLYQQVILDHNRDPHNFGKPANHTHAAEGDNPLCGDHYHVFLSVDGGVVKAASFEGTGCAISQAAASIMTDAIIGKTVDEVRELYGAFHDIVRNKVAADGAKKYGKLSVFSGIWQYPARVKCAILCWHAVKAALEGDIRASTEESA